MKNILLTTIETWIDINKWWPTWIIRSILKEKSENFNYIPVFSINSDSMNQNNGNKISFFSKFAKYISKIPWYRTLFFILIILKFNKNIKKNIYKFWWFIHAHDILSWYFWLKTTWCNKLILSIHWVWPYYKQEWIPYIFRNKIKNIEKYVLLNSKTIIFPSQWAINLYLEDFCNEEWIVSRLKNKEITHIVYNWININDLDYKISKLEKRKNERIKVITVANYIKSKWVAKIPSISSLFPDLDFEIIWEWELKEELENNIKNWNIKNLYLSPKMPKEALIEKIYNSDFFLMPSVSTVFDLVMLETMYIWWPIVIASNISWHDEMIQNWIDWFLVENNWYVEILELLLRLPLYKQEEIRINAKNRVLKDFTINKMIQGYEKFYN